MYIFKIKPIKHTLLVVFLLFTSVYFLNAKISPHKRETNITAQNKEYVVLFHGLFRSNKQMKKAQKYLEAQGYKVLNIDYPSTKKSLEEIADSSWVYIKNNTNKEDKINFIGYSMGGLVIRVIIGKHKPYNMGRVVLIATPNHGSEVADFFKNNWLYKKITGPAGQELVTNQENIKYLLKPINYELGVIAGNFSIDPLSSIIIKGKDDGKVSIESTKLKGMQDHIVISASHFTIPRKKITLQQSAYFLKHGMFKK